jgi:hypothetical protein
VTEPSAFLKPADEEQDDARAEDLVDDRPALAYHRVQRGRDEVRLFGVEADELSDAQSRAEEDAEDR